MKLKHGSRSAGRWLGAALWLIAIAIVSAESLTNFAGLWNDVRFSTPAFLSKQPFTGPISDFPERAQFETGTAAITVQPDGSFSGSFGSGQFTITGVGLLRAEVPGDAGMNLAVNQRADVLAGVARYPGEPYQDFEVLLRAPASLTPAEIAGNWNAVLFRTPATLLQSTNLSGRVVQLGGRDRFGAVTGTLTVQNDGTLSGNIEGPFTGSTTYLGNGVVQVTIDPIPPDPSFSFPVFINAGKDFMATVQRDASTNENFQQVLLFTREGPPPPAGSLQGVINSTYFETPAVLIPVTNASGEYLELQNRLNFAVETEQPVVGHTGVFTLPAKNELGRIEFTGNALATVNVTNAGGGTYSMGFFRNTAADVLIAVERESSRQGINLVLRAPETTNVVATMGLMIQGANRLAWASDTNRFLQVTTNFTGWLTLTNTGGQSTYPLGGTNAPAAEFYRLLETP